MTGSLPSIIFHLSVSMDRRRLHVEASDASNGINDGRPLVLIEMPLVMC